MLKLGSSPPGSHCPSLKKLATPSVILICHWEPSNIGKQSTFQRGTNISALSTIHGPLAICSQMHSTSGIRCFPTMPRHSLEPENQSFTWLVFYLVLCCASTIHLLIHFQYSRPSRGCTNGVEVLPWPWWQPFKTSGILTPSTKVLKSMLILLNGQLLPKTKIHHHSHGAAMMKLIVRICK